MKRAPIGLVLGIAATLVGLWACAPRPASNGGVFVPRLVAMPAQPPEQDVDRYVPPPAGEADVVLDADANDAGAPPLPLSWAMTFGHTKPFAEAIQDARTTRASFESAAKVTLGSSDGGAPSSKVFERANSLLDLGSRQYAAAYHAPDAADAGKIETLAGAAAMILAWSRRLDELGLARAPAAYRNNPSVALTFEDVALGPAKHWREEGAALAQLCGALARTTHVDTAAARECLGLQRIYARVVAVARSSADAGSAASGCACDPGDPLCSASMSGWCRPK